MHRKASPNSTNSGSGCSGLHGDNTQFMNAAFRSSTLVVHRRRVGIMSIPTVPTNTTSKFHLFQAREAALFVQTCFHPATVMGITALRCRGTHIICVLALASTQIPWVLFILFRPQCLSGIFSTKHRQDEAKPDADGRLPIRIPPEPCRCFGMGIPERQFFFPYRRRRLGIINVPTAPTNTTGIFSKLKWQVNSSECQRSCRIPSAII